MSYLRRRAEDKCKWHGGAGLKTSVKATQNLANAPRGEPPPQFDRFARLRAGDVVTTADLRGRFPHPERPRDTYCCDGSEHSDNLAMAATAGSMPTVIACE